MDKTLQTTIPPRIARIRERIAQAEQRFGRKPGSVGLLAVSKKKPATGVRAAFEAGGQGAFGENYVQEALDKMKDLADLPAQWHFIGPIQSNKTRAIAEHFAWVHSLDRPAIARRLSEQRPPDLPPLAICLQVNVSGEATKSGVDLEGGLASLFDLALAVMELPRLDLRGLMTIPAPSRDEAAQREPYRRLREARDTLDAQGLALDTLSMGMSDDLEAAIAEGATLVRIGTGIFGAR
uniref:Pyridoxal phosphate homeostasis protein n=1 Tax=Candidatus Kentrum eta TaxID=2126337 RepID=A0A450UF71_9GAMM|nr:MAG: hypothetical protein BECKH772A_GA0070896_1002720 [Candidatus Kentron sp. H]VFJ91978.1 MAG: hypothetical protein BECKH772B_GA0070898_1002319 [Candidatus Kentron sp. H]VFJ98817.1 MAG: hypothetical protein BECKH772C_GA0070978_1002520 [Candidatus Kentron sp. H]